MSLTVGGWIGFGIIALLLCFCGFGIGCFGSDDADVKSGVIGLLIGIILSVFVLFGFIWYYSSTASGARAIKTQESNFQKGLKRRIEVYDVTGNMIKEYTGTFDVEYDDDRILFDDENGFRHIIYYPTGTVIIDEVE